MTRQTTPSILDDLMRADERIQQLPIDALDDNPYQRRSASVADDDPDLLNLSTDIAQQGIIQHLVVRPHPNSRGRYQIAAGHRRSRATEAGRDVDLTRYRVAQFFPLLAAGAKSFDYLMTETKE